MTLLLDGRVVDQQGGHPLALRRGRISLTLLGLPHTRSLTTSQGSIKLHLVARAHENIGCLYKVALRYDAVRIYLTAGRLSGREEADA